VHKITEVLLLNGSVRHDDKMCNDAKHKHCTTCEKFPYTLSAYFCSQFTAATSIEK